jgi:5-hydroxyisourate hydrolase-like protein (transthyretin family)
MKLDTRARELTMQILGRVAAKIVDTYLGEPGEKMAPVLKEIEEQVQKALEGGENEFVLRIQLGNERMRTMRDVAFALLDVSDYLKRGMQHPRNPRTKVVEVREASAIRDVNGNTVGGWTYHRRS